jgi:2-polyprenyl-3-methyl-5-hydroxy-6-metoxy-1,4-benzoquinol methylase
MERLDPENNETRALLDMVNFYEQHVLEIGCGNGRMTWRYADMAAHVTAIDPVASQIALAKEQLPGWLRDRLEFQHLEFEDFADASAPSIYDIVFLSQSLC